MGAGSTRDALPCLLQVRLEIKSDDHYDVAHFKTVTLRFLCFRNDTARGGPSSQKRKHMRKKLSLKFFKNEFLMIKFMKMTNSSTSSAATT